VPQLAKLSGTTMPTLTSADAVPSSSAIGSRILCDQSLDPTSSGGTTAGEYVANGAAWVKVVDLGSQLFSPLSLSPALWLKADALSLADGATISSWPDSSGNGRSAAQANGTMQPLYKAGIINSKPVVRFDGVNDYLATSGWGLVQPCTVFLVGLLRSASTLRIMLDGTGGGNRADLYYGAASGGVSAFSMYAGATLAGPTTTATAAHVLTAVISNTASALQVDGGTATTGTGGTSNANGITLGSAYAGSSSWADLDLAEVLVYPAVLTTAQQNQVRAYLKTKYATP
jgi:hypothetical protein